MAIGGWFWLNAEPMDDEIPQTLRSVLGFNERVARAALFSDGHLVKTFPASAIGKLKVNGEIGMDDPIVTKPPGIWRSLRSAARN